MKRLIARLLAFILMLIMLFSVIITVSSNFPAVYRIIHLRGEKEPDGDYIVLAENREEELLRLPKAGGIIENISRPLGFAVTLTMFLLLLWSGRKRTQQRSFSSAVYEDYCCESVDDDVSVFETSEGEETSVEEVISLSEVM